MKKNSKYPTLCYREKTDALCVDERFLQRRYRSSFGAANRTVNNLVGFDGMSAV